MASCGANLRILIRIHYRVVKSCITTKFIDYVNNHLFPIKFIVSFAQIPKLVLVQIGGPTPGTFHDHANNKNSEQ